MKKISLFFVAIFLFTSCAEKKEKEENEEVVVETEAEMAFEDMPILLGKQNRKAIETKPYNSWFVKNYMYQPDQKSLATLHSSLNDITITVFMGTWCEDSVIHVPALYGILDAVQYDTEKVTLITVSEDKDTPEGLEEGMDIQYVPTIILFKNGKELGRIVESPVETLEADLVKIATGEPYAHTYADL